MGDWCILLCDSAKTLALADALEMLGFEVWAPTLVETKRVPRANVKRRVVSAMMPGYIFARSRHVVDLLQLAGDEMRRPAKFRFMREPDRIPLIADAVLGPLRRAERYHKPLERKLLPGERVRLTEGAFAGCSGVVETARGKFAMVAFPGFRMPLKIAEWHLLREDSGSGKRLAA
jgi:transcription antitermination factor NusG